MMSLTFGLFNQVSGLGPLGPLVDDLTWLTMILSDHVAPWCHLTYIF